jgi:hypothetical protein
MSTQLSFTYGVDEIQKTVNGPFTYGTAPLHEVITGAVIGYDTFIYQSQQSAGPYTNTFLTSINWNFVLNGLQNGTNQLVVIKGSELDFTSPVLNELMPVSSSWVGTTSLNGVNNGTYTLKVSADGRRLFTLNLQ